MILSLVQQIKNIAAEKSTNIAAKPGLFDSKEIKKMLLASETPFVTVKGEEITFHQSKREAEKAARANKCIVATVEDNYLEYRQF